MGVEHAFDTRNPHEPGRCRHHGKRLPSRPCRLANKKRTGKIMTKGTHKSLSRRRVLKAAAALSAGMAAPAILRISSALAAYPERPVKIVVANTPGGPSDLVGRMVSAALQQSTGKTFII